MVEDFTERVPFSYICYGTFIVLFFLDCSVPYFFLEDLWKRRGWHRDNHLDVVWNVTQWKSDFEEKGIHSLPLNHHTSKASISTLILSLIGNTMRKARWQILYCTRVNAIWCCRYIFLWCQNDAQPYKPIIYGDTLRHMEICKKPLFKAVFTGVSTPAGS